MSLFRRAVDPELEAARIAAQREQARFELERARVEAQLAREQQEAQAEFARRQAIADEQERRRRDTVRRAERAERRDRNAKARAAFAAKLRPVLPLLLINGGAAYAQAAYAYSEIAPATWNGPSRVAFAVAFSAALESIAVYVQWHAHDALMLKAHGTATSLRRASWGVAGLVAAINYAHFAGEGGAPTAAAVAFALLSLLSPWLWGLHTRRAQHVQLLAEDASLIDESGVDFSPQRIRAFPIRAWQAKRWSIDHYETDPRRAWEGYNAERLARRAEREDRKRHAAEDRPVRKGGRLPVDDDLDVALEIAAPTVDEPPAPAPVPIVYRPRWRPPTARRPRRMGRPAPAIAVTVVAPERPARPAKEPANGGRPVAGGKAAKEPASTEQKVAALIAKKPAMTQADVAATLQIGERTVRRYWPKPTAAVNGHNHRQTTWPPRRTES
ncbi:hypothetical protein [Micromonospora sp. NBC_00421]|uniref:hypothetical protein n=1 Tax=Micromonospora sp. NBC_00421 TaxID=2975976 RepID=UPI002E1A2141